MLSGERLLIIEEEFIIALDIQRILEGANAHQTVFARNFDEAAELEERLAEFDLAIVTPPRLGTTDWLVADRLIALGIPIVVCSATLEPLDPNAIPGAEIIDKPYSDEDLLAACRRALARRRRP